MAVEKSGKLITSIYNERLELMGRDVRDLSKFNTRIS